MPRPRSGLPAWAIALIVVAVVIVLLGVVGVVMFVLLSPIDAGRPTRPLITFTGVRMVTDGFEFSVAVVSQAHPASSYRVNLVVNGSSGTSALNPSMSFVLGGEAYTCTWTDLGGEGQLTGSDVFRVTRAGGLVNGTTHTFVLLWFDGAPLVSVSHTP